MQLSTSRPRQYNNTAATYYSRAALLDSPMHFFEKMTVFRRVISVFAVVLAMSCGLGGFAVYEIGRVGDAAYEIRDNWLPSVRYSLEMKGDLSGFRSAELQHVLSTTQDEFSKYETQMTRLLAAYRASEKSYTPLISSEAEREIYRQVDALVTKYMSVHERVVKLSQSGDTTGALALMRGESIQIRNELDGKLKQLVELNVQGSDESGYRAKAVYESARTLIFVSLAVMAVASALLALGLARSLVRQLGGEPCYAAQVASEVAGGNLDLEVRLRPDDTSSMLYAMSLMRDTLASIVHRIKASSDAVAVASGQIAQGNADLSQRTEEQASALEETAASLEELTSTVKLNADNAGQANDLAKRATSIAERGGMIVGEVVTTMGEIEDSSIRIVDIIAVIESIAFQTNILALNAAVEAARAGQEGRGFAVVAAEVRSLAQRSADAAREIKNLIEGAADRVSVGAARVRDAGETMEEIVRAVQQVSTIISEISSASIEQTSGIEQVNSAVGQIDQVTQQNAALVEEAAAAAASLEVQSQGLLEAMALFKISAKRESVRSLPRLA